MPTPKTGTSTQEKELKRKLGLMARNSVYGVSNSHIPCVGPAKVIPGRTVKNKMPIEKMPKTTENVDSKYFSMVCTNCWKIHEIYFECNVTFLYGEIDKSHETEYLVPIDNSGIVEEFTGTHRCSCNGHLKLVDAPELSNIVSMFGLKGYTIYNVSKLNTISNKVLRISIDDNIDISEEDISRLPDPWLFIHSANSIELKYHDGIDNVEYHIGKLEDWVRTSLSHFKG